jgi:EAL domain-containing protein (putative c-di-GMP-specific phosphodiesterase class I)
MVKTYPSGLLRGLMLLGVWGLATFGWSTLGERALMERLPPIQAATDSYGAALSEGLKTRTDLLEPLANDPRVPVALASPEGMDNLEMRRALYEFGYLNRLTQLYVWDDATGAIGQLAGSRPLPPQVVNWLKTLDGGSPAVFFMGLGEASPASYLARRVGGHPTVAYALMPAGWQRLLADLPAPPTVPNYPETAGALLVMADGQVWLAPLNARKLPTPFKLSEGALAKRQVVKLQGGQILVSSPVPGYPSLAAALLLPSSVALGSSRFAQWAAVLAALLATIVILWKPTRPIRRKVVEGLKPVANVIKPLAAPLIGSVSAVVRGQRAAGPEENMKPGEFTEEALGQPKRMRAMNVGSAAARPRKASAPSFTPAVRAKEEKPEEPVPPPPTDELAKMIDESLTHGNSQLLYQPIYRSSTGAPAMHEVLVRLLDKDGQPLTPAVFIPVCQKHGWMERVDAHVVQRVLDLNFAGGSVPSTPLALNLSGDTFDSIRYIETLMNMAAPHIMQNLVFEVRSQELMQDKGAVSFLRECREMGVKLSVDYFGGGAAMVEASKQLGFDYVKMDCTRFGADTMAKKELIVLCRAAQRVDLPVVLEKMETVAMEVFARKIGVTYLQGYLLGKPKPELVTGQLPGWRAMAKGEGEALAEGEAPPAPSLEEAAGTATAEAATPESPAAGAPPPVAQG